MAGVGTEASAWVMHLPPNDTGFNAISSKATSYRQLVSCLEQATVRLKMDDRSRTVDNRCLER